MKYLFFDLEYATSKGGIGKICEFGYVVIDEHFKILERNNYIINPNIYRYQWDYRVVREILHRTIEEYEQNESFDFYYYKIANLIKNADRVFGHSLNGDVSVINSECIRYNLPSIDFTFYDIKEFYKEYNSSKNDTSVKNILKEMDIEGEEGEHDAEVDAVNTMYELKAIVTKLDITVEQLIAICPSVEDKNSNYKVESIVLGKMIKEERINKLLSGEGDNTMIERSIEYKIFSQFTKLATPTNECKKTLENLKFAISLNYSDNHYKQMLNIVQIIINKGGSYALQATHSDIFVEYSVFNSDNTPKECIKLNYVKMAIEKGKNIKIINFDQLLTMLEITEDELNEMPMVNLEFLYKNSDNIHDPILRRKLGIKRKKEVVEKLSSEPKTTLGELFHDFFTDEE